MADINMDDDAAGPRRPISLPILTQFLDSLQSYSQDLVQHLQSGAALCHYTTLEGLYGIILSGDLWLTNSRYCNDNEELKYGNRVVEAVLTELQGEAESNKPQLDWLQNLRAEFRAAREDEAYICCFCEKQNLLSQWRGYADDGGGVGIEFDAEGFRNFAGPDSPFGLMRLWKVFYSKAQQRDIVRKAIEYPYWPTASPEDRIHWIVDALQFFVPTFKNEGFHEEQKSLPWNTNIPSPVHNARWPTFDWSTGMETTWTGIHIGKRKIGRFGRSAGPYRARSTLRVRSLRLDASTSNVDKFPEQIEPERRA